MPDDSAPVEADNPAVPGSVLRHASLYCLALAILLVAVPLAIRLATGSIPENDDWSYVKSALTLHRTHRLELQGFAQMFLIGQLLAVQPLLWLFGSRTFAFDLFGALATLAWLCLVFAVTRRLLGDRRALLVVCIVGAWPGLGLLSTSFMTDAPFAAVSWAALCFGIVAFERRRALLLAPAFVLALAAFTVREQAVAVPAAIALFAAAHRAAPRRLRQLTLAGAVATVAACYVLEHLRRVMPHADVAPVGLGSIDLAAGFESTARAMFTFGLALAPVAVPRVLATHRRPAPTEVVLLWAGTLAVAVPLLVISPHTVLLGNYLSRTGGYPNTVVGTPPPVFGPVIWGIVQALAVASTAVVVGAIAAWLRHRPPFRDVLDAADPRRSILVGYFVILGGLHLALAFLGQRQYDRYLLPMLPIAAVLLLRAPAHADREAIDERTRRRGHAGGALVIAFLYVISLCLTASTYARDRAVWAAAGRLTREGVPSTAINAGSDWNGLHATTAVDRKAAEGAPVEYVGDLWVRRFPRSSDCYVVSTSPLTGPGWRRLRTSSYRPYGLGLGTVTVYVYRRTGRYPIGPARC